jgi:hypothetical protein
MNMNLFVSLLLIFLMSMICLIVEPNIYICVYMWEENYIPLECSGVSSLLFHNLLSVNTEFANAAVLAVFMQSISITIE